MTLVMNATGFSHGEVHEDALDAAGDIPGLVIYVTPKITATSNRGEFVPEPLAIRAWRDRGADGELRVKQPPPLPHTTTALIVCRIRDVSEIAPIVRHELAHLRQWQAGEPYDEAEAEAAE